MNRRTFLAKLGIGAVATAAVAVVPVIATAPAPTGRPFSPDTVRRLNREMRRLERATTDDLIRALRGLDKGVAAGEQTGRIMQRTSDTLTRALA